MKLFKQKKPVGRRPINQTGKPNPGVPVNSGARGRNSAFSYYAGDMPVKKDNVRARQVSEKKASFIERLRLLPTVIAIGVIALSIVYSTTLSSKPGLVFAGGSSPYRSVEDYRSGISKVLSSSVFNKSKLTLNSRSTSEAILNSFPELDIATVTMPVIGRRPLVTLHARHPALILTTPANAYVIDSFGKVVAKSTAIPSSAAEQLLTVQDQSGLEVGVGTQVLTSKAVAFITSFGAQLNAKQLTVTQVTLPSVPNEVDIRIKDLPYYIKADMTGDARLQAGVFIAAKEAGHSAAEYMDVRVEDKVFFK